MSIFGNKQKPIWTKTIDEAVKACVELDPVQIAVTLNKRYEGWPDQNDNLCTQYIREILKKPEGVVRNTVGQHEYADLIEKLEQNGLPVPCDAVKSFVESLHPYKFYQFGLVQKLKKYLDKDTIQKTGRLAYADTVKRESMPNFILRDFLERRTNILNSFELKKGDVAENDKNLFSRYVFEKSIIYNATNRDHTGSIEAFIASSSLTKLVKEMGLQRKDATNIMKNFVSVVLGGKMKKYQFDGENSAVQPIYDAYGMVLEFGKDLGLSAEEELSVAKMYAETKYSEPRLLGKRFKDYAVLCRKC
jgi:hypothetical protein